jgi:hypothetical protein
MKPIDYLKALALAFMIMALEMLLSYPAVYFYAVLIAPGHPDAYYAAAAADWIVPWWVRIGGTIMFLFAGWLFTGRVRHRNAWLFIAAMCGWYLLIELVSFVALGGLGTFLKTGQFLWIGVQFAAAFAGVYLALRTLPAAEQPVS